MHYPLQSVPALIRVDKANRVGAVLVLEYLAHVTDSARDLTVPEFSDWIDQVYVSQLLTPNSMDLASGSLSELFFRCNPKFSLIDICFVGFFFFFWTS